MSFQKLQRDTLGMFRGLASTGSTNTWQDLTQAACKCAWLKTADRLKQSNLQWKQTEETELTSRKTMYGCTVLMLVSQVVSYFAGISNLRAFIALKMMVAAASLDVQSTKDMSDVSTASKVFPCMLFLYTSVGMAFADVRRTAHLCSIA